MCKSKQQYRKIHSQVRLAWHHEAECQRTGANWDRTIMDNLWAAPLHVIAAIRDYRHPQSDFRKSPIGPFDKMFGKKTYHGPKGILPGGDHA